MVLKINKTLIFFNKKKIPFPVTATLNCLYSYAENYGVKLYSSDSEKFKIIWRKYHSSITLILIEKQQPIDEKVYSHKLDMLFDALVLVYGLEDLINITNNEKFKKEITSFNFLRINFVTQSTLNEI